MLTHKGTIEIKTQRLTLRRFKRGDAQAMFDTWANDERVTRYMTWDCHGTVDVTKSLLDQWVNDYEKENSYNWAIELNGKIIGSIGALIDERSEHIEIGYCSAFECWGKGIMTEAATAIIDFLFREVNANKIIIQHATKNPGSGRVAQKCGLTLEGIQREHFKANNGELLDIAFYSILRKEWQAKNV